MAKPKSSRVKPAAEIIPLNAGEVDSVHALDQLCFPAGIAFSREIFEYCLQSPDCISLGLKAPNGDLLGFIILQAKGRHTAQIVTLDISPDHRRQGLAGRLMAVAETLLQRNHIHRVYLQVAADNRPGRSLYRKWGYVQKSVLSDYYGPGQDALMMSKELSPEPA